MLAWGLPSGLGGACDNPLIPERRCPVKRTTQETEQCGANDLNVHTSICELHPTLPTKEPSDWQVGEWLHDRWEIYKILKGGMGIVYIVYDQELHKPRRQDISG